MREVSNPIPSMENPLPQNNALSLYSEAVNEEFPVLKAFQQYIDAEQEKARKRMLLLCVFFGVLMTVVIVVFLVLFNGMYQRNQSQNDRFVEFLTRERDRQAAVQQQPVVQAAPQDNATVLALMSKIDDMQKQLVESERKAEDLRRERERAAEKAAAEAAVEAAKEAARTREQLEIERLKALLEDQKKQAEEEKKKAEEEKIRKREEELEAYRRKHYPELYAPKVQPEQPKPAQEQPEQKMAKPPVKDPIDELLEEFKDQEDDDEEEEADEDNDSISYFDKYKDDDGADEKNEKGKSYAIPVDIKESRGKWRIPNG